MLGAETAATYLQARSARPLAANDARQDYLRAKLEWRDGEPWVDPIGVQDSAMQTALAAADALIFRAPNATAVDAGDPVQAIPLAGL
jgi:molybdopterin molybdotransferase